MIAGFILGLIAWLLLTAITAAVWAKCPIGSRFEARANRALDFFFSWQSVVSFALFGAMVGA